MNLFSFIGDMLHLGSMLILLFKIKNDRSCTGISLKSQILFTTVFVARYLDLFSNYVSFYITFMKITYIGVSLYTLDLIMRKFKFTYDKDHDTFKIRYLIVPSLVLAIITFDKSPSAFYDKFLEILWTFSIYLESVAILPQLILLQRTGEVESLTSNYIVLLGGYRAFYFFNWIYRIFTEHWSGPIEIIAGLLQTGLYADFFYYYAKSKMLGKKLVLPQ
ncbi:hypothetical protein DICPUDRAFT_51297 [Dictyostelium purpureum]|uniref:ER lumen protein-retaining receptor n=1 Tax=Dictyostelium purpureum TaxID=5786 RepID=F1A337_DICPU|nr:uncharacterized protein DICPUDRAFT_51297 [Dictyostelium purpureum]EGC29396.1 hypothetical protein DICPUDRAFT_51297 [Dictyostelium purpureum]|eukprot:XP_003294083.1 hypothetical protein DICPUDRAFT_51297 [Dictyostelium purpureum]